MNNAKPGGMSLSYGAALIKAAETLSHFGLEDICRETGAELRGTTLSLPFLGTAVQVTLSREGAAAPEFTPENITLFEKILLLHYLAGSAGRAAADMVAFKNLPGASFYDPTYQKRGPRRIARQFGERPADFHRVCRGLGWTEAEFRDISYSFDILPRIRGIVVLQVGDEEFPPESSILFSRVITGFLPLEDVAVLAGIIATRMSRAF